MSPDPPPVPRCCVSGTHRAQPAPLHQRGDDGTGVENNVSCIKTVVTDLPGKRVGLVLACAAGRRDYVGQGAPAPALRSESTHVLGD
jgi:hypothetical protein